MAEGWRDACTEAGHAEAEAGSVTDRSRSLQRMVRRCGLFQLIGIRAVVDRNAVVAVELDDGPSPRDIKIHLTTGKTISVPEKYLADYVSVEALRAFVAMLERPESAPLASSLESPQS